MIAINSTFAQSLRNTSTTAATIEVVTHREDPSHPFPSATNELRWYGDMQITLTEAGQLAAIDDMGGLQEQVEVWAARVGMPVAEVRDAQIAAVRAAIVAELATGHRGLGGYRSFEIPA